jgi:hypothetical protein
MSPPSYAFMRYDMCYEDTFLRLHLFYDIFFRRWGITDDTIAKDKSFHNSSSACMHQSRLFLWKAVFIFSIFPCSDTIFGRRPVRYTC